MTTWSQAFAAQAASDLSAYEFLAKKNLPVCHRLHYLQMWLEKLCKAYLWSIAEPPDDLLQKHNVIAKVLPSIVVEHWRRVGLEKPPNLNLIRELCREIDLLQPQIRDGNRRPDNSEYPWLGDSGEIEVPARWRFPVADRLYTNPGKLLIGAAERFTRSPALFADR
jgi:hypothetical protein